MIRHFVITGALAVAGMFPALAAADGHHGGDIAVSAVGGKLVTGGDHFETHGLTGLNIFEANFGDLSGGPWVTKDPGFQTQGGATLKPNALISFEGLGVLNFWNGASWNVAHSGVGVSVLDVLDDVPTTWTADGVEAGESAFVSQVSLSGSIHDHLKMSVTPNAAAGAYMIELKLTSDDYASSDAFYIVFNRGLSSAAFENSVEALVMTPVPEPASYALMFAGLFGVLVVARRRASK